MIAAPSRARVKLRPLHCWRGEQARFKAAVGRNGLCTLIAKENEIARMSVLPSEGVIMMIHFRLPSNPDFRLAPMPTDDPHRVSPKPCTNIVFALLRFRL